MNISNRTAISLGLFMGLISLGYWEVQTQQDQLIAATNTVETDRPRAYILRGYRIDLGKYTTVVERSTRTAGPHARRLVMVSSDTCQVCKRDGPRWPEDLKAFAVSIEDEVVFVTLNSADNLRPAIDALRSAAVPWRLLRVSDVPSFVASTGFVATPMVAVLDSEGVVEAVGKTIKDGDAAVFHRILSNPTDKGGDR